MISYSKSLHPEDRQDDQDDIFLHSWHLAEMLCYMARLTKQQRKLADLFRKPPTVQPYSLNKLRSYFHKRVSEPIAISYKH